MWSIGVLLILGTVLGSQESNGFLLPKERREDPCSDRLSKMILEALSNRHFITNIKSKLIMEIALPNFADVFTGRSSNEILSQEYRDELSIPDLDPDDPIHNINFPDSDRGTLENGIIIPEYENFKNVQTPSHGRTVNQIIYHYNPRVPNSFKPSYSNPNKLRKEDIKKDDDKVEYPDIFQGLDDQETEERGKEKEEAKEMENIRKKLEETKKPEEPKKTEASAKISESGSPQNRINYLINHHKNGNRNSNVNHNLNPRRHKWIRNQQKVDII